MDIKFANNASSLLLDNIAENTTAFAIFPDTGALFPDLIQPTDYFKVTLVNPGDGSWEIVKVTRKDGDLFTVERAQEGSTAKAFPQNSVVENRLTAGSIEHILNDSEATGTEAGRIRRATAAEVALGVSEDSAVTPATLAGVLPLVGSILAFSGSFDDYGYPINPKTGQSNLAWHICDGTENTPDLRDRFIMCAGPKYQPHTTGGNEEVTPVADVKETVLTVDQMPRHVHNVNCATAGMGQYFGTPHSSRGHDATWSSMRWNSKSTDWQGASKPHKHEITVDKFNLKSPYYALSYIMKIK